MILKTIEENYDSFIETVLSDVSSEISRLSIHFVGLQNFATLFTDSRFPYSIFKTILFVLTSVPLKVIFGIIIAFLFSSPLIYGRKIMRAMLLIPWALPVLLSVTTWRMLFAPDGPLALILSQMLNYKFSIYTHEWDAFFVYNIVEMWLAYPFIMTITMGAIASVPKEFIEASYMDGISVFSRFRKIMLPLTIKPILFATILTSGASLQAFMVPLLINDGGPTTMIKLPGFTSTLGNANELMILYGYNRAWLDQQYGLSTATFLVVVAILFIYALIWFYFIYRRGTTK
jgi:arabinogalactan oligomer/maltooligosaccharide transport system permease protein